MDKYSLANIMFPLAQIFLLLWAILSSQTLVRGEWENMTETLQTDRLKPGMKTEKFYYFDQSGSLIVNVSKPGFSPPIAIDTKKYYPACTTNVYFTFIFTVDAKFKGNHSKFCEKGVIMCYEGQLVGEHLRHEYNVPNLADESKDREQLIDMITKCVEGNGNKTLSGIRGLNMAVKSAYVSAVEKTEGADMPSNEFGKDDFWHFFVLSGSFFKDSIAFPVPKDGSMILQIGNRNDLYNKFMDADGRPLMPLKIEPTQDPKRQTENAVKVTTLGKNALVSAPDMSNGALLRDHRGLWMLYLDFKSDYRTWQVMSTVHPPQSDRCQMSLEIRGNRMRPCRSYYEDIAKMEPVNAQVRVVYTSEVGTVRQQKRGQEDLKATATRIKKEQMQMQASRDQTHDYSDQKSMTEDVLDSITAKEKTISTDHINRGEHEISLNANPTKAVADQASKNVGGGEQDGANAKLFVGGTWEERSYESSSTRDVHTNTQTSRNTDTMFKDVNKAKTMMNHFKSTSGEAESMEEGTFMKSETAFNTRETLDVTVDLPPNTKLIIRQLMFDCDGNLVKLPFIEYVDGLGKKLALKDDITGIKRSMPDTRWNQTLEDDSCFRPSCKPPPNATELEQSATQMLLAMEQMKFQAKVDQMLEKYPGN